MYNMLSLGDVYLYGSLPVREEVKWWIRGFRQTLTCWMDKLFEEREVVNEKSAITLDVCMPHHSL